MSCITHSWSRVATSCLVALAAVLVGLSPPAGAAAEPSTAAPSRVALVIGNGAYPTMPLDNPVNDARAMAEALQSLGFKVTKLENASLKGSQDAIRAFGETLKANGGVG